MLFRTIQVWSTMKLSEVEMLMCHITTFVVTKVMYLNATQISQGW